MTPAQSLFVRSLAASARGERLSCDTPLSDADWQEFFSLCREQHALPLAVDGVCNTSAWLALPEALRREKSRELSHQVAKQTLRTRALCRISAAAQERGLHFLLMKGIACRAIYPVPDARPSSDEDLLVPEKEYPLWAEFLSQSGFAPRGAFDPEGFECGFVSRELYVELHRLPFSPDSPLMGAFNACFAGVFENAETLELDGASVPVMAAHEHMLYLLLHAFKHLVHSGFGLRQLCDIVLWAERRGGDIRWTELAEKLEELRCARFAAAVFELGCRRFGFDGEKALLPECLSWPDAPCDALLEDMLLGGVYGGRESGRVHSATITLRAVESSRAGRRSGLLQSLFPNRKSLEGAYPFLRRAPVLLPLAWIARLGKYALGVLRRQKAPSESLRIGSRRKQLLKDLDILD